MRGSGADGDSDQARQQVSPHGRFLPLVNGSLGRLLPVAKDCNRPKAVTRQQQLSTDSIEKLRADVAQPTLSLKSVRFTRCKPFWQGKRIAVNRSSPTTYA